MRRLCAWSAKSWPPKKRPAARLRQRIEQMGPVNMMALDEYKETAERHGFLETQRKDLMESIENTQETIKEIDQISRTKFDEAFAQINENFALVFCAALPGRTGLPAPHRRREPGRERPGDRGLASGQEAAERAAALRRRKIADRAGAAGGHLPVPAQPLLRARRSGCGAGRNQRGPPRRPDALLEQGHAVPGGHSLQAHDASRPT